MQKTYHYKKAFIVFSILTLLSFNLYNQNENIALDYVEIKKDTLNAKYHFYISKYTVSVYDYKTYLDFLGLDLPDSPNYGWFDTSLPMVLISYDDFMGYVNWMSDFYKIQFRAPTDVEWSIAAANQENSMLKISLSQPSVVHFGIPNKYGIYGMNGNVWEWTSTLKDKEYNIIRGGSFSEEINHDSLNVYKSSAIHPSLKLIDVGFRLAIDAKEMQKYIYAISIENILKKLFPEYTNLGVDAESLYINDGFINWSTNQEIIEINLKENFLRFCNIDYLDDKKSTDFLKSEKFYFNKEDVNLVKKLKSLINTRELSLFQN